MRKDLEQSEHLFRSDAPKPSRAAKFARFLRALSFIPGWKALVNKLVPESPASFLVCNRGIKYAGDLSSYIDRQIYLFGGYERAYIRCFIDNLPSSRRRRILDVGSNAGTHSLAFAQYFEAVHAFEPNPLLWIQFETNIALNGVENVQLHKVGLGEVDDELPFHLIDKPNLGLGTFSPIEQYDLPLRMVGNFPVRHGSRYLAATDVNSIDALKIDVQGFEPEVLRGLEEVLRRDRPAIWCEIGAGTRIKVSTRDDLSELIPFDFICYQMVAPSRLLGGAARLRRRDNELPSGDYLLIPS